MSIIDLSKAGTPEGRAELSIAARNAMRDIGFFYVINHGYSQDQVNAFTHNDLKSAIRLISRP